MATKDKDLSAIPTNSDVYTYGTSFKDLFDCNSDAIEQYLKVGMGIWYDEIGGEGWKRYVVTYIRSGVVFLRHEEEKERAFYVSSFAVQTMSPETIYINELAEYYSSKYDMPIDEVRKDLLNARWCDYNGKIKIKAI